ncbi:NTP transferase domain-containing protein [Micromonospora sp. WMMA1363]|uniref:nucleotidyltransferase family protein n=1 Tax=Micromonospora sp. WMMA1363 TaxID=3053985 RepID=UPI00259CB368|nr:NTP transferase domain-containing protein [Micromonospora sp. WMMA1363]MDM4719541.1 NTP transferase domain-containing protein [Micromonospora sp. WMMA1363]
MPEPGHRAIRSPAGAGLEAEGPVAGLVLAAGAGRRYGGPKALVGYEGRPLVLRARDTLAAGGCAPVLVVVGAHAEAVTALVGSGVVRNPAWVTGMGSSLRAGLAALETTAVTAVVVLLVDTPDIGVEAVRRVVAAARPDALVVAGYRGRRWGHPVLLGREHWVGVAASATMDRGARDYLRQRRAVVRVVPCADIADCRDLDVPRAEPM